MSISEKIDKIISIRNSKVESIENCFNFIKKFQSVISEFEYFRDNLKDNNLDSIKNIKTDKLKKDSEMIQKELERLITRFSRPNIHLTFVGEMGAGKSLVMQRISGLGNEIIPSADGPSCTGAKSIITNTNDKNVKAKITFFTEDEIVEIVNNYLETIFGEGKISKVNSIMDIKKISINDLPKSKDESVKKNKKTHLENYIKHIDDFKEYLGEKDKIVKKDDIKKYVAQYNSKNTDEQYYNFLAVKEANIFCHFLSEDCGNIVLVDTVGLGETSLGVENKMFEAVKNNADAIIYMVSPDLKRPDITEGDHETLDKIIKQVTSEYTEKMLFWIVNKNNKDGKAEYKKQIPKLVAKLEKTRKEEGLAICNDKDDVEEHLLKPVLKQMSERLKEIDDILISNAQNMLRDLFKSFNSFTDEVENLSEKFFEQDIDEFFIKEIDISFGHWTGLLKRYCNELKEDRECENEDLRDDFYNKLDKIFTHIPRIEEIQKQLEIGYKTPSKVYHEFIDFIRIQIINDFLGLDKTLSYSVDTLKKKIVHILADNDKGKFCHIVPICDNPDDWLECFLKEIVKEKNKFKDIYLAIDTLRNFTLTTKNYLIHEVRNSLDSLDPFITHAPKIEGYDEEEQAENIREYILDACEEVKREIEENCSQYIQFSNKAFWATVRDFYDRVTFSINLKNDYIVDMKEIWRQFYKKYISLVWSEEYNSYQNTIETSRIFNSIKESIVSFRSEKNFEIN